MREFNRARLTLARSSLGWTKSYLAEKAGITSRRLQDFENRGVTPSEGTIEALAVALEVPVEFFYRLDPPSPSGLSFRSLSSMSAGVRDRAYSAAMMTTEVGSWISSKFDLQAPNVPTDMAGTDPVLAAAAVRERWGIGLQPAPNLIHLAELMGVRVFSLAVNERTLDAFSYWHQDTPYILLNSRGTAERRRWDVAHELGHLLLHAGGHHLPTDRGHEEEADQFASALLLPAEGLRRDALRVRSLAEVRSYKLRWKVSAFALIRTLHKQRYLTDWEYRTLAIDASKAKLRRFEDDIDNETSPALTAVLRELRNRGLGPKAIAQDLSLRPSDVRNMFHMLAPVVVSNTGATRESATPSRRTLRLVTQSEDCLEPG